MKFLRPREYKHIRDGAKRKDIFNTVKCFKNLSQRFKSFIVIICSFKRGLRHIKIHLRLMISFLVLSLIPLAFTGMISYRTSSKAIDSKVNVYSEELIKQLRKNIQSETEKMVNASNDFIFLDSVQQKMVNYNQLDTYHRMMVQKEFKNEAAKKLNVNNSILNINIVLPGNEIIRYADTSNLNKDIVDRLVGNAPKYNGKPVFSLERLSETESKIVLSRAILSKDSGKTIGILIMMIQPSSFEGIFEDIYLGESAELFIIDANGTFVYGQNKGDIGKKYKDSVFVERMNERSDLNNWIDDFDLNGQNCLISVSTIKNTDWRVVTAVPYHYLRKETNTIGVTIAGIFFICLVLAVVLSILITNSISNPLNRLVSVMKESKNGNLATDMKDTGRDEISDVTQNFNEMLKSIKLLISQIQDSVKKVLYSAERIIASSEIAYTSSQQISLTAQEIAKGAISQARDVHESAHYMNTLSDRINGVAGDMAKVSGAVQHTRELSEEVLDSVELLNQKALETNSVSAKIISDINELNQDMKNIKDIVKVIVDIAEKTNMLSLNASIEAARAGEVGRGFGVVAGEVKKLADQSKESSKSIDYIISAILKKTQLTANAANDASNIIDQQMEAVQNTNRTIKTIYGEMEAISLQVSHVEDSVTQMIMAKQKALDAIENIATVSEETAATTQQVSAGTQEQMAQGEILSSLAKELKEMAYGLETSIQIFKF